MSKKKLEVVNLRENMGDLVLKLTELSFGAFVLGSVINQEINPRMVIGIGVAISVIGGAFGIYWKSTKKVEVEG